MHEVIKEVVLLSELLKNASVYYGYANPNEKEAIIRTVFSELSLSGETLTYKCKKGFQALEKRFISKCDPIGIRTRVCAVRGRCPNQLDDEAEITNNLRQTTYSKKAAFATFILAFLPFSSLSYQIFFITRICKKRFDDVLRTDSL